MGAEGSRLYRFGLWCDGLLEGFAARVGLSTAIFVSLLPIPLMAQLDGLFLTLFAGELVLRTCAVYAVTRPPLVERLGAEPEEYGKRRTHATAWGLLAVDTLALLSFMPVTTGDTARWLRVFRLTRMLALVGYWAPILGDLWSILGRRERFRQVALMGVVVGGLSFAGALVLFQLADLPFDADEDGQVDDHDGQFLTLLWWAFRQVQDPGNMLESPLVVPAVVVSLALTVFGLFLVSFLIGLGTDVVHELLEQTRMRPPGFRGHTVIVNMTPSTRRLLLELWGYYRKLFPTDAPMLSKRWWKDLRRRGLAGAEYVVIGRDPDPPEFLREAALTKVVYRSRPADEEQLLSRSDLVAAKRVLILADRGDEAADAETIRTLLTLVERVRARERHSRRLPFHRTRVVIAEILDDSNVMAARAALATAGRSFRGWVVPTEKLLGLFLAGVVRRPGLGALAGELLTSTGHEIYTCFFATPGLGFQVQCPPNLGGDAGALMDALARLGAAPSHSGDPVIPIGVLMDAPAGRPEGEFEVVLNPEPGRRLDEARVRGVVALGDSFRSVGRWVDGWGEGAFGPVVDAADRLDRRLPTLVRTHRPRTTRVLVCGFRPGTVYLLEELFRSDPTGEVLLLVADDAGRQRAVAAFDAHGQAADRGQLPGRHGLFAPLILGEYSVRMPASPDQVGRLRIEVADWMANRHLVDLPAGFGHVRDLDAVLLVGGDGAASDPRITTTLLKLEELCPRPPEHTPQIVAEVFDDHLAARLAARARELGTHHVQVFSSQELRAFFLFQAVVVPGFDAVWEELLGAWGQSLVHKQVAEPGCGSWSFIELGARLREQGELLVAVQFVDAHGQLELVVAPGHGEQGGRFEAARLRGVWVIAADSGEHESPGVVL